MCKEKTTVHEFGEEVVLCCDEDLTNGYHYDKFQNLEWRVPDPEVYAKVNSPSPLKTLVNKLNPQKVRVLSVT